MAPPALDKTIKSLAPLVFELGVKLDSLISVQSEMKTEITRIEEKSDKQYQGIAKQIEKLREDTFTRTGDQAVAVERAKLNATQGDLELSSRVKTLEDTSTAAWKKIDSILEKLSSIMAIVGTKEEWKEVEKNASKGNTAYTVLAAIGGAALASIVGILIWWMVSGELTKKKISPIANEPAAAVSMIK